MNVRFLTLLILFCCYACNNDQGSDPNNDDKDVNAVCDLTSLDGYRMLTRNDKTREYVLHIPLSYDENNPTPVVINYHGFGDCADNFFKSVGGDLGLNDVADAGNFIVVYPQALVREKGDAYWEPGDNGNQDIRENDSHFTRELISELSTNYNIDLSRIYATGYSNGGMMAYGLVCATSDLIAAIGVMSGIMLESSCQQNGYTSVIHFHGIEDHVLPYDGNVDYQSVADVIDLWVTLNNILDSGVSSQELNNGDVILDEYHDGSDDTSVVLYTIQNEHDKPGGHVWFSGEISGQSPNEILWAFLSQHKL